MKKVLVAAIIGLAAIASVKAQSFVTLYNYGTPSAGSIRYGTGSGGTVGQGVVAASGFTVGLYWASGNVVSAVDAFTGGASTQGGQNIGSLVGSGLSIATGAGATVALGPDGAGIYDSTQSAILNPSGGAGTYTLVLVAYNGASYETSSIRGHSGAFTMNAYAPPTTADENIHTGLFAPAGGFAVAAPEPSTFALAGLGLASLLIFRRRK